MSKNSKIESLSYEDILRIVFKLVDDFDPMLSELTHKDYETTGDFTSLMGTSFWTFIQLLDNYLAGQLNPNVYNILREMEKQIGESGSNLPKKPETSELYNRAFFKFSLDIRLNLSSIDKQKIIENTPVMEDAYDLDLTDSMYSFTDNYVPVLQRYELEEVTQDKENIDDQLAQNDKLVELYFEARPEIAALMP